MLKSEADVAALLDLYKKVRNQRRVKDDEANPLVSVLRLSGVTRVVEGLLYVRNRIYFRVFDREWVLANLPDAEVQRQRAAYRRGALRTAAIAFVMLAVVSGLAFTAFRQRNRAVQSEQTNRRLLYTAHMNLAAQDWESGSFGRMRELLDAYVPANGQADERGVEWFYLWRLGYGNTQKLKSEGSLLGFSLSPDEKLMAAGGENNNITIWETKTWQKVKTLSGHKGAIWSTRFSPDGQKLMSKDDIANLRLWDLATGQEISNKDALPLTARGFAFSPDGTKLAVGYVNGTLKVWDMGTWREMLSLAAHQAYEQHKEYVLDFSSNGKLLASAARDGLVKIWDLATGKEMKPFKAHTVWIHFVRFSPDSRSLAYFDGPQLCPI